MRTKIGFFTVKIVCLAFILGALLVPLQAGFVHGAEGIALEKDVFLQNPILGVEDLPDAVTFALYASESATTPLATQTFPRGEYTLDFEFNKSDGVYLAPIARLKVDFTGKLNMGDDPDNPVRVREIWSEVRINGQAIGDRTKVTDEAMVKLLLASDASIATYLTLVYEGDNNPIATIYRDLPLASSSRSSANEYITSLFSAYSPPTDKVFGSLTSPFWEKLGSNIFFNEGYVGIGTNSPKAPIDFGTRSTAGQPFWLMYNDNVGINMGIWRDVPSANNTAFVANSAGSFVFGKSTTAATPTFGTELMRITNDGKVGIGTNSPKAPIDFGTRSTAGQPFWLMYNDNVGINMGIWRDTPGSNNTAFVANSAGSFVFGKSTIAATPTFGTEWMRITSTGNVGIGTTSPAYTLAVNGTIGCKEVTVTSTGWADFVFEKSYRLPPLNEVEEYVAKNKHLRGIPTEAEVKQKGVNVGNISSKLLQKIEELTLYVIDLKKENDSLKAQLTNIQEQLGKRHN